MPGNAWMLIAALLLVPSLAVGWLRFVAKKDSTAISGFGGVIFAFICFAAALWVIFDKLS
jgi:hypothetical protein